MTMFSLKAQTCIVLAWRTGRRKLNLTKGIGVYKEEGWLHFDPVCNPREAGRPSHVCSGNTSGYWLMPTGTWNIRGSVFKPEISTQINQVKASSFHLSSKHSVAPVIGPILVKLATPLSRVAAILVGRRVRKWWQKLPQSQKEIYLYNATKRRDMIMIVVFGGLGLSLVYYGYHLEECKLTGRKRFMLLTDNQMQDIANRQCEQLMDELSENILHVNHINHMRVYRIAKRILDANNSKDVSRLKWQISVIESDLVNAFVLPNGQMFVMTGMLKQVANDDELAGILGHEMAHAILRHSAEQLSFSGYFNLFSIIVLGTLWAIVPTDGLAILANFFQGLIQDILLDLPYARKLEKEADCVGLLLTARACYDVRKISEFWKRMDKMESDELTQQAEWLSTHPAHANRAKWINDWLPQALDLRRANRCPELVPFYTQVHNFSGKLFGIYR